MKVSLNLDDYLSEFRSLTFSNELLETYYIKRKEIDNTVIDDNGNLYYYLVDNSENYYKELLKSRYPKAYDAINIVIQPTYLYSITTDREKPLTWRDWYDVVTNAYMMKGSEESIKYLCMYLGISVEDINYDLDNLKITISVSAKTQYPDLCRKYLIALAYDLLLLAEENITIDFIIINYDIDYSIIYQTQLFTTVNNSPDNEFIVSLNSQVDKSKENVSSMDEFKKYLLQVTSPDSGYEDTERYDYYNERIRVNIDSAILENNYSVDLYRPSFIYMANNTMDMTLPNVLVSQVTLDNADSVAGIADNYTPEFNPYGVGRYNEDNPDVNLISNNKPEPDSTFVTTKDGVTIETEPEFKYDKS